MEPGQQASFQASSKALTVILVFVFGVLGAALESGGEGLLFGAMFGFLFAQVFHLRGRVQSLQEQLQSLRLAHDLRDTKAPKAPAELERTPPAPTEAAAPPPPEPAVVKPAPAAPPREDRAASVAAEMPDRSAAIPPPPPRPAAPPQPTAFDRIAGEFMSWLKRGNPLARIGIVILFFGATFLAKYAADNSLFPIELRFVGIASGALALLFIGWRLRDKRAVYAQLLQGGGIAGLYLTVFAATRFDLLPTGLAFGLLVVIALAAAILAVGQNALSLAVIGTAGGFLAPIMVSTGSGNYIALFTYYAVLNLGVFAVAWFRTWRVLNVLGFVFTFTITGLWRATGYESADRIAADAFLILFFLMYVGVSILNCVRQPPDLKGYLSGSLVFGLPVVALTLHASMVAPIEYAMAWSALAFGVFYLALGAVLHRTGRESFRLVVEAFAALGVIFGSLAIPLAFDSRVTAAMWAVEGAGLLWIGVRQQRKLARAFGALLQIAAGIGCLIGLYGHQDDLPILNSACLGTLMLSISGLCSGYWLFRNQAQRAQYETGADVVFTLWGVMWWLIGGLREIDRFVLTATYGVSLSFVALTAALLALLSLKREWRLPLVIATYLPAVCALFALTGAINFAHPFVQWGAVGWLLLFSAHFWVLRLGERRAMHGLDWFHVGASWVLTLIIAWEASYQVGERTTGVWPQLPWGVVPALMVAWFGRRQLSPHWPLAVREHAYRLFGALPLIVAVGLWVVYMNLTSTGDSTWIPYMPLLNPLDISVALCLAALAMWWSALTDQQRATAWRFDPRALIAAVAGIVFIWLNAALIRTLHHNFGAPVTWHGMYHSTLVQASLSIFWGLLGFTAMTLAARQRWRYVWLVGAALMIVVVAKLLLVDLSNIGTIARITSFLTVGVLLLVTGYLAPLPPKKITAQVAE
ncbi:DUF2339 domain-containing protein [Steroidobacter sp. S1-65]|uniref:DUF2339 domain-containing protein n=1 Tax=Steroidobacter gossypii TaxID=2805490 RepID=A0ABS1WSW9_9GAMM|nr:DUF2339 domain-containing protein [Steroidobacter gossypii]MBM0104079.1 DUF2339 domain-containing protein [Steroidobacter gossypii]